jgi:hypothetical protein
MKKVKQMFVLVVLSVFWICSMFAQSRATVSAPVEIDDAIQQASREVVRRMGMPKVAILNFTTTKELSDYVISEMNNHIDQLQRDLTLAKKEDVDRWLKDNKLTSFGDFTETNARNFGRRNSFDNVVIGNFVKAGTGYRFRLRIIDAPTGRVLGTPEYMVAETPFLLELLGIKPEPAPVAEPVKEIVYVEKEPVVIREQVIVREQVPVPVPVVVTEPAQVAQPAVVTRAATGDAVYTFDPRPRASEGGMNVNTYLVRVKKTGNYTTFYFNNKPTGLSREGYWQGLSEWNRTGSSIILQDLDNTLKTYNPIRCGETKDEETQNGYIFITFEGLTGYRFSLTNTQKSPNIIFNEIVLANPDR